MEQHNKVQVINSETKLSKTQEMESTGILRAYINGSLTTFQANLTVLSAINGNSIALTRKVLPERFKMITDVLLCNLFDMVRVGKQFEPQMMPLLQQSIFKRYYYLTIEEYAYVLLKGALGEYGKIYDRLDFTVILEWFEKYDTTERMAYLEKKNQNEKVNNAKELKESISLLYANPIIAEQLKSISKDIEEEKRDTESEYQKFKEEFIKKRIRDKNNTNDTNAF
jgi:hypothetical protein